MLVERHSSKSSHCIQSGPCWVLSIYGGHSWFYHPGLSLPIITLEIFINERYLFVYWNIFYMVDTFYEVFYNGVLEWNYYIEMEYFCCSKYRGTTTWSYVEQHYFMFWGEGVLVALKIIFSHILHPHPKRLQSMHTTWNQDINILTDINILVWVWIDLIHPSPQLSSNWS